jgi:endonuclease-3
MTVTPTQKKRAAHIHATLKKLFPKAHIQLRHKNPWELLVAVILSAQCTDKKVNEVTATLFKKYPAFGDYLRATPAQFARDIRSTGFFNSKTKSVLGAAHKIQTDFDGEVPRTMEELLTLPGVARKTANVVLSNAFDVVSGIAVDTHVKRFAQKFELTKHTDPNKIERDLMRLFPKKVWNVITYELIEYGRQICPARKHECTMHPLTKIFPKAARIWPKAK